MDEAVLLSSILSYFSELLKEKPNVAERIMSEFKRGYEAKCESCSSKKELSSKLKKLKKAKQKYTDMYLNELSRWTSFARSAAS